MNLLCRSMVTTVIRQFKPIAACRPCYRVRHSILSAPTTFELLERGSVSYNGKKDFCAQGGQGDTNVQVSHYRRTFTELYKLGEGGYGRVFLCRHRIDQHLYAIKQIRFFSQREEAILSCVNHQYIVKFYDSWWESSMLHIQMEYCPSSLDEYLEKEWVIEMSFADRILMQLLEALVYLSKEGIVHRDICPMNVLLDDKQNVRLGDFGQGKFLKEQEKETRMSEEAGHVEYMAPEMKPRKFISEAVDIYSLGLVYFRMVLHTQVWSKDAPMDKKVMKFRKSRQIPICLQGSSYQSEIALIRKMTTSRPWERPQAVQILEAMRSQVDFTTYEWNGEVHSPARERYLNLKTQGVWKK